MAILEAARVDALKCSSFLANLVAKVGWNHCQCLIDTDFDLGQTVQGRHSGLPKIQHTPQLNVGQAYG